MYFSLTICNDSLYQQARKFFIQQGRSDLLSKAQNSLIGAYLITQHMREIGKTSFSFIDGKYSHEELFFSTSHSENMIAIAIDDKKVAVDIESIHSRDVSLLKTVNIKNIQNCSLSEREIFYVQRCAKECLVKFLNLTSESMEEMHVISVQNKRNFTVNDRLFDSLVILYYKGSEYSIRVQIQHDQVLALLLDE